MKRSKNIFNKPILSQSLLDDNLDRELRISNRQIRPGWLIGVSNDKYIHYIYSAMHLAELDKKIEQLKEQAEGSSSQLRQSNTFLMANLQMKINNFTLIEEDLNQVDSSKKPIKKTEPNCSQLIVQKIAGFMNTSYQRKCRIDNHKFFLQTRKDASNQQLQINLDEYNIILQDKQTSINDQKFKLHIWLKNATHRLLLSAVAPLKLYCIYGPEEQLKAFQRYFSKQIIKKSKVQVFGKLSQLFNQKIITLFGNKVRFYEHNLRTQRAERQIAHAFVHITTSHLKPIDQNKSHDKPSNIDNLSQTSKEGTHSLNNSQHQLNPLLNSLVKLTDKSLVNGNVYFDSHRLKAHHTREDSTFKLRGRNGTVFYDQIDQPITYDHSPLLTVKDFRLNLREQIGMSDVDQQSQRSQHNNDYKQVLQYNLKNNMDVSQSFRINIYEVKSDSKRSGRMSEINLQFDSPGMLTSNSDNIKRISLEKYNRPNIKQANQQNNYGRRMKKQSSSASVSGPSDISQLVIDSEPDGELLQSYKQFGQKITNDNSKKYLIRNIQKKQKPLNNYFQHPRPTNIYLSIEGLSMFLPFNQLEIHFELLQLDPQIEMDRKYVYCRKHQGTFLDNYAANSKIPRYKNYSTSESSKLFRISNVSDQFVLVIKNDVKDQYLPFTMNANPLYQINCSQFLVSKLANYTFAAKLIMHISPTPIIPIQALTTLQFLHKYLLTNNYSFKHDFINEKRRHHQIIQQWNLKVMEQIIEKGDQIAFQKQIYKGISDKLAQKLLKTVPNGDLLNLSEKNIRIAEDSILSVALSDIRSFMKPSALILKVFKARYNVHNAHMMRRFQQVAAYCFNRYGSATNFGYVFVKEVLAKIESILLLAKKEEEVDLLLDLYFEVEYQIDQLFGQIAKYFKP